MERLILEEAKFNNMTCMKYEEDGDIFFETSDHSIKFNLSNVFGKGNEPKIGRIVDILEFQFNSFRIKYLPER